MAGANEELDIEFDGLETPPDGGDPFAGGIDEIFDAPPEPQALEGFDTENEIKDPFEQVSNEDDDTLLPGDGDPPLEEEEDPPSEDPRIQQLQDDLAAERARNADMEQGQRMFEWQQDTERLGRMDTDLAARQEALQEAFDGGDTEAQAKLTVEIAEMQSERTQLKINTAKKPDETQPAPAGEPGAPPPRAQPKLAAKLVQDNPWIMTQSPESQALRAIDSSLSNEGYDPEAPDYYAEMERRFSKRFPNRLRNVPKARRAPARPARGGDIDTRSDVRPAAQAQRAGKSLKLTKREMTVMRGFGLNPSNKEHRALYIKNRNERIRNEQANR